MDPLSSYAAAVASGALIGLLLSLFGGGGSVLATPLLIYAVGVRDPHIAIGTSAAVIVGAALLGLASQARAGRVKWPCALVFGGAGLAGSLVGAVLGKRIDGAHLLLWFAVVMGLIGLSMLAPARNTGDPDVRLTPALTRRLAPMGAATGLAAGFFGIGGGFLIVPGLMATTGMTLANAAASSLISVALFGLATSATYAASGLVAWPLVAAMLAGGAVGIGAGGWLSPVLAGHALLARRLFAVMIIVTAAYVAWKGVGH